MDLSVIRKEIVTLSAQRQALEKELLAFRHPMAKGSLYLQYTRCTKPGCRCMQGEKHGPFYYLSLKKQGRTVQRYVGKHVKPDLEKRISRYGEFNQRLHALRKLDRELTGLWNQFREELTIPLQDRRSNDKDFQGTGAKVYATAQLLKLLE